MTIKINLTPKEYEVEDPKYGSFTIIPLGVNKDLELQQISREIGENLDELQQYAKPDKKLSNKEVEEASKRVEEIAAKVEERKNKVIDIWKSVFIFKDKKKKEQLFNDITLDRIRQVYEEVLANA